MGKSTAGTTAFGRMHKKKVHATCPRCGRRAYHIRKGYCAACGFGRSPKIRKNAWRRKKISRSVRIV